MAAIFQLPKLSLSLSPEDPITNLNIFKQSNTQNHINFPQMLFLFFFHLLCYALDNRTIYSGIMMLTKINLKERN